MTSMNRLPVSCSASAAARAGASATTDSARPASRFSLSFIAPTPPDSAIYRAARIRLAGIDLVADIFDRSAIAPEGDLGEASGGVEPQIALLVADHAIVLRLEPLARDGEGLRADVLKGRVQRLVLDRREERVVLERVLVPEGQDDPGIAEPVDPAVHGAHIAVAAVPDLDVELLAVVVGGRVDPYRAAV